MQGVMMNIRSLVVTVSTLFLAVPAIATDVRVKVTGEVNIAPCQVNNGNIIEFTFTHIMSTKKIDGQAYAQSKTIPFNCGYYHGIPYVKVIGLALSGAPENVLKATISQSPAASLGLALYQGSLVNPGFELLLGAGPNGLGYPIVSGLTGENSATDGRFTFTAVPYSLDPNLPAGNFSATASLSISYL